MRLARARCPYCGMVLAVQPPSGGDGSVDAFPKHPRGRDVDACPYAWEIVQVADYTETI